MTSFFLICSFPIKQENLILQLIIHFKNTNTLVKYTKYIFSLVTTISTKKNSKCI